MSPEERKFEIERLNEVIREIARSSLPFEQERDRLIRGCPHNIVKRPDPSEIGQCTICGEKFGWYCPKSPDHQCNYEYKPGKYNFDCCIFCGQPDERK